MAFGVEQDIFGFKISDDDAVSMPPQTFSTSSQKETREHHSQVFETLDNVAAVKPRPVMSQYPEDLHLRRQIPTGVEVHDEVEVLPVAESMMQGRDEWVVRLVLCESSEDGDLGECVIQFGMGEDGSFGQGFESLNGV